MFITYDLLKEKGACDSGLIWFKKHFPNGCELNEQAIAAVQDAPTEYIWWFYNNIQQDERLYRLCAVKISNGVNRSKDVNFSDGVSYSLGVNCSNGVNRTDSVSYSNGVNRSEQVHISSGVNFAKGLYRSCGINESNGIESSKGVCSSCNIARSQGVMNSLNVSQSCGVGCSGGVNRSNGIDQSYGVDWSGGVFNSFGVVNSFGVSNALFLADKERAYSIFGKEVSEKRFNEVQRNLYVRLGSWRPTVTNIKETYLANRIECEPTTIKGAHEVSRKEVWADMPKAAIEYVKSLPEFDAEMFERITGMEV